jgi:hypothetical protein
VLEARDQPTPTPRSTHTQIGTETTRQTHPRQTEAQIAAETPTQTHEQTETQTHEQTETQTHEQTQPHRQPNHHQKINKGEGRASYGEQRERTEKRERAQTEVRREKKTGEMRWKEEKKVYIGCLENNKKLAEE